VRHKFFGNQALVLVLIVANHYLTSGFVKYVYRLASVFKEEINFHLFGKTLKNVLYHVSMVSKSGTASQGMCRLLAVVMFSFDLKRPRLVLHPVLPTESRPFSRR